MTIAKDELQKALRDQWLDTYKERLKRFYDNEVTEDSGTADAQLRNSMVEMKKAFAESVTIVDEIFPDGLDT